MKIKYLSKALTISLGAMLLVFSGATLASASPNIEVTMKNNGYHFDSGALSGTLSPGFTMTVGEENTIVLKNEDTTAHDFVSKAFNTMDVIVVGEAKSIKDGTAMGWRVQPGKTVKLRFTPRVGEDFGGSYDVFYCTIHGKANMKGEIVVADTRTGSGAF
jgi:plastocyanin